MCAIVFVSLLYIITLIIFCLHFLVPNVWNLLQVPQKLLSVKELCDQIKLGTLFWTAGIHLEQCMVPQFKFK
jgi:hypothetical protein